MSAHYPEILRYVAAASLDELEALRAHVASEIVRRRQALRGLDADELERRDTLPSPAPTPRSPLPLDEPGDL